MREIKFRGWDTKKEMMALNLHTEYDTIGDVEYTNGEEPCLSCFNDYLRSDEWIVMQYTGLKDKNGVEIYEGDVVKYQCPMLEEERTDSITFADGTFRLYKNKWWKDGEHDWHSLEQVWYEDIEVIGNIYQNPELIK